MVLSLVTRGRNYRCRCKIVKDKFLWQDWFKGKWGKYKHGSIKENRWQSIDLSNIDQYCKVSYTFWNDAGGNHKWGIVPKSLDSGHITAHGNMDSFFQVANRMFLYNWARHTGNYKPT